MDFYRKEAQKGVSNCFLLLTQEIQRVQVLQGSVYSIHSKYETTKLLAWKNAIFWERTHYILLQSPKCWWNLQYRQQIKGPHILIFLRSCSANLLNGLNFTS